MSYFELLLLSVSLALDCFAVSCTAGVSQPKLKLHQVLLFAFFFGLFQAMMPLIGWFCGEALVSYISRFGPWIAFFILLFIGGKMIVEGVRDKEGNEHFDITRFRTVLLLSVATSIDALAVGFGFAMMQNARIGWLVLNIGVVSFLMSLLGYGLTSRWSNRVKANIAEIIGGLVLIGIGLKILIFN